MKNPILRSRYGQFGRKSDTAADDHCPDAMNVADVTSNEDCLSKYRANQKACIPGEERSFSGLEVEL